MRGPVSGACRTTNGRHQGIPGVFGGNQKHPDVSRGLQMIPGACFHSFTGPQSVSKGIQL